MDFSKEITFYDFYKGLESDEDSSARFIASILKKCAKQLEKKVYSFGESFFKRLQQNIREDLRSKFLELVLSYYKNWQVNNPQNLDKLKNCNYLLTILRDASYQLQFTDYIIDIKEDAYKKTYSPLLPLILFCEENNFSPEDEESYQACKKKFIESFSIFSDDFLKYTQEDSLFGRSTYNDFLKAKQIHEKIFSQQDSVIFGRSGEGSKTKKIDLIAGSPSGIFGDSQNPLYSEDVALQNIKKYMVLCLSETLKNIKKYRDIWFKVLRDKFLSQLPECSLNIKESLENYRNQMGIKKNTFDSTVSTLSNKLKNCISSYISYG